MREGNRSQPLKWMPPLARTVRRVRWRIFGVGAMGVAFAASGVGLDCGVQPAPRVIWNASASAPIGFWRVLPGARVGIGDMVVARTPERVRRLAAARRYIPATVPLLKRIVAAGGDEVCALGPYILINGRRVAARQRLDPRGRRLPWWSGCRRLRMDRVLLMMRTADSFDGRYFGPIGRSAIIGKAIPLWLR